MSHSNLSLIAKNLMSHFNAFQILMTCSVDKQGKINCPQKNLILRYTKRLDPGNLGHDIGDVKMYEWGPLLQSTFIHTQQWQRLQFISIVCSTLLPSFLCGNFVTLTSPSCCNICVCMLLSMQLSENIGTTVAKIKKTVPFLITLLYITYITLPIFTFTLLC